MKHLSLSLLLLALTCLLLGTPAVTSIVINTEFPVLNRVVLNLNEHTVWTYNDDAARLKLVVNIENGVSISPSISGLQESSLIRDITFAEGDNSTTITFIMRKPYKIDTMELDNPEKDCL